MAAAQPTEDHDWHSATYVDGWIAKDLGRVAERQPLLAKMLSFAPFPAGAKLRVLDIGAGYGAVTDAVLTAYPGAEVTLQDYSQEMLDRARGHLSRRSAELRYVLADLVDPSWSAAVGGPFDLVVSAIALHNLADMGTITGCYRAIHGLLAKGGCFLDCDHFIHIGGVESNRAALRQAGFTTVECLWQNEKTAILKAS